MGFVAMAAYASNAKCQLVLAVWLVGFVWDANCGLHGALNRQQEKFAIFDKKTCHTACQSLKRYKIGK